MAILCSWIIVAATTCYGFNIFPVPAFVVEWSVMIPVGADDIEHYSSLYEKGLTKVGLFSGVRLTGWSQAELFNLSRVVSLL